MPSYRLQFLINMLMYNSFLGLYILGVTIATKTKRKKKVLLDPFSTSTSPPVTPHISINHSTTHSLLNWTSLSESHTKMLFWFTGFFLFFFLPHTEIYPLHSCVWMHFSLMILCLGGDFNHQSVSDTQYSPGRVPIHPKLGPSTQHQS